MPISGKKVSLKMKNNNDEFVTVLQGKYLREYAQRLATGKFTIEKQSLNRYKVTEGVNTPEQQYTLINRRSFVLLDKEIYRIQARKNPLAACIEKALDNDALEFCVSKYALDAMPVKLIAKTFSTAKVSLESVTINNTGSNYLLTIALVKSVSERDLTQKEQAIAEIFIKANEIAASAGNPETEKPAETLVLPPADTVNTTAKTVETIPAK